MGCTDSQKPTTGTAVQKHSFTFEEEINFLRKYIQVDVLLEPGGNGLVAVSPNLQGRVMTSSPAGLQGMGFGWINHTLFESKDTLDHINPFGGEERFWLGPEGGQYSIFFKEGAPFNLETWQTPPLIDIESFERTHKTKNQVTYEKTGRLINYSGFTFDLQIERSIQILSLSNILEEWEINENLALNGVAYKTINTITNIGAEAWKKETGNLSIWLLGMFNHSDETTIVIPYVKGPDSELGPIVNDDYFGKVPSERLKVDDKAIYFKGDGKYRSKIGLSPMRALNVVGSYASDSRTLTIIRYSKPESTKDYVNSQWEIQDHPYRGDVINSYNDGPAAPGQKPLGPFYELETSSPALSLQPSESATHSQETIHFQGDEQALDKIAQKVLGVSLVEIEAAL